MPEKNEYGERLFADGRIEEAKSVFEKIILQEPENLNALNYLGIIAYQAGELEKTVGFFTRALSVDPYHKSSVLNICEVYRNINRLSEVRPLLESIVEKHPDDEMLLKLLEESKKVETESLSELAQKEDLNTPEHWDSQYHLEVGDFEWRRNIVCFGKIKSVLGIIGDNNDTVLDIGCGYGVLFDLLEPLGFDLCGWDISAKAIETINQRGYKGRCLDFINYEHSDNDIVDHVISSELLEHVREPYDVLKKMYHLARKTVIIAVPDDCLAEDKYHLQCFNKTTLRSLVENLPFKKIFIDSFLEEFQYKTPDGKKGMIKRPTLIAFLVK